MMGLPSYIGGLGVRSDQLLRPVTARYLPGPDRSGGCAVVVDERPDFWTGNLLVLAAMPSAADVPHLYAWWTREIGARGGQHPLVQFESPWRERESVLTQPVPPGVEVEWDTVFRAPVTRESRHNDAGIHSVRQLTSESDWHALRTLLTLDEVDPTATDSIRAWQIDFLHWRLAMYAQRAHAMFGVWHDHTLIGAAGVLWDPELAIARYQAVITHPAHRRQGICRALLAHAHHHLADRGWPVVLVASHGSPQEALYTRYGFEPVSLRGAWHLPEAA